MHLHLDTSNGLPIYEQIVRHVKFAVANRLLQIGEHVPSVREMATRLVELAETWDGLTADCRVTGPAEAPINKLRGKYRFHFLLQSADEEQLHAWINHVTDSAPEIEDVLYIVDFDPQEML